MSGEKKTFLECSCDISYFFMRLELWICCLIEGKENRQEKKGKVVIRTDIMARMTHVTKEKLGDLDKLGGTKGRLP